MIRMVGLEVVAPGSELMTAAVVYQLYKDNTVEKLEFVKFKPEEMDQVVDKVASLYKDLGCEGVCVGAKYGEALGRELQERLGKEEVVLFQQAPESGIAMKYNEEKDWVEIDQDLIPLGILNSILAQETEPVDFSLLHPAILAFAGFSIHNAEE